MDHARSLSHLSLLNASLQAAKLLLSACGARMAYQHLIS